MTRYTKDTIAIPSPKISEARARWKRNRDFIEGDYAVKTVRGGYLRRFSNMSDADYLEHLNDTEFFPAAARAIQAMVGLIFRQPSKLEAPDNLKNGIFEAITSDGQSLEDMAEWASTEFFATNYTGLLNDYPKSISKGVRSVLEQEQEGLSPIVTLWPAESIMGIDTKTINDRRVMGTVRLAESEIIIRELTIETGVYTVNTWTNIEGDWHLTETTTPMVNDKTLDRIPFELVTTETRSFNPPKAPADDIVNENYSHFRASARLSSLHNWISTPQPWLVNHAEYIPNLSITPGTFWQFPLPKDGWVEGQPEPKFGYLEHNGAGSESIERNIDRIEKHLAQVGSRMLQSDKLAAEAAETLQLRSASEKSVLAGYARIISRGIERTAKRAAEATGYTGDISFNLNTDFFPNPMTAQEITSALALLQAGAITHETFLEMLVQGEILPETFDKDYEIERLSEASLTMNTPDESERIIEDDAA